MSLPKSNTTTNSNTNSDTNRPYQKDDHHFQSQIITRSSRSSATGTDIATQDPVFRSIFTGPMEDAALKCPTLSLGLFLILFYKTLVV